MKTKIEKNKKEKIKRKKNNTLLISVVVIILFAGIVFAVYGNQKTSAVGIKNIKDPLESLKEIRKQIDDEYSQKGVGTNTPAVRSGYVPILSPRKADKLPDYVYTNALTLQAYKYATEHPEAVEQMACYCGCAEHGSDASEGRPHRFLRDCFITDKGEYDSHAAYCDLCVGINIKTQDAIPNGLVST